MSDITVVTLMCLAKYKQLAQFSLVRMQILVMTLAILAGCQGGGIGGEATGPDPGIIDYPIAYVKKPYAFDENDPTVLIQPDLRDPLYFAEGGDLYIREFASLSADEANITRGVTQGIGDVKDVDVSHDGTRLVFALHLEEPTPNNPTETWNIWEYDLVSGQLRRLIENDAEANRGDDVDPHYLPGDQAIVFSSNRQDGARAIQTSEGKSAFSALDENEDIKALVLHTMDMDGQNLQQISFNQSHDLDPVVMPDGRIIFSRWDNFGPGEGGMHLYGLLPDGTGQQIMYGAHSHDTGANSPDMQFVQARPMSDGDLIAITRPFTDTYGGGDIVRINIRSRIDNGHTAATVNAVVTDGSPSPAGRYSSAYPLWDGTNRMLVSKSQCRLLINGTEEPCTEDNLGNANAQEVPPEYSLWMYDLSQDTQKPVVFAETGEIITDVVVAQSRINTNLLSGAIDDMLAGEGVGLLHIRSVYDEDGSYNNFGATNVSGSIDTILEMASSAEATAAERPARYLRLVKAVGIPDPDDPAGIDLDNEDFGPQRTLGMREILGYMPIEPDGSVMTKVPADVAFIIEVLDSEGRRVGPRHDAWLQVKAGEQLECHGCHSHVTDPPLPHGRPDLQAAAVNQGAGYSFPINMSTVMDFKSKWFGQESETLAQVRYNRCQDGGCTPEEASVTPSVDVTYQDFWTDDADPMNPLNPPFDEMAYSYLQASGEIFDNTVMPAAGSPPTTVDCIAAWDKSCRIVINYEDHIHPIWSKSRLDASNNDATCTTCHNTLDINGQVQVPAGQLNLSENFLQDPTFTDNGQMPAYQELFFTDTELVMNAAMNGLEERLVPQPSFDTDGNPITIDVPVNVVPSMTANGARRSYFFEKLTNTQLEAPGDPAGGLDHTLFLTPAEKRIIAEWLDIGAQYYNDPSDVPQN